MNDEQLGKYLAGEATPEEAAALEDWLDQSPENRAEFHRVAELWYAAAGTPGHVLPDKEQVLREIGQMPQQTVSPQKPPLSMGIKIGLAVVIVATSLLVAKWPSKEKIVFTGMSFSTNENIHRDTLANGGIVILDSQSTMLLQGDDQRGLVEGQLKVIAPSGSPVTIEAEGLLVTASDAEFSVGISSQSGDVVISSHNGTVQVQQLSSTQTVAAGSRLIYHPLTGEWKRDTLQQQDKPVIERVFNFQDERLEDIMQQLGKAYDVRVRFDNQQLKDCRMSGGFENQSLNYVMDIIAVTLQLTYKIEKNVVVINGETCE